MAGQFEVDQRGQRAGLAQLRRRDRTVKIP
jgi:hypothetical protein